MKITFNEVSFRPYSDSSAVLAQKFHELLRTYSKLKEQYGVKHLVSPTNLSQVKILEGTTYSEWIRGLNNPTLTGQILSTFKKPYSKEFEEELTEENALFYFENKDLGIEETACIGLELASRMETATISIDTDEFWHSSTLPVYSTDYETDETQIVNIQNCCLDNLPAATEEWFLNNKEVVLVTTETEPGNKKVHFRDDHGQDVLLGFAKRIVNSEYVCSVINSLPFNSNVRKLIKKCDSDGTVEMVLYWDDRGIGMVVQTTGRNLRETEAIAEILRNKFDK